MAATIQQIVKPTRARGLDTSGNNNHAQIYSGRGLEFDGVTDYLSLGGDVTFVDWSEQTTQADKAWTISFWVKWRESKTSYRRITGHASSFASYIAITSDERIAVYSLNDGAWQVWGSSKTIKLNTWYRVAVVFDGSTKLTTYLNGVSLGDKAITEPTGDNGDLKLHKIGDDNGDDFIDGWLSDFQAWQGAWTADDAEYDYLNPEQLVLNRSGTSLTNSNLKLWYPMNEGHRGNQSYVLDASNTGIGENVLVNGDFATGDLTGWTTSGDVTYDNGGVRIRSLDGTNAYIRQDDRSGVTYKLTYDVLAIDSTSNRLQLEQAGGNTNLPGTSIGDTLGTNSLIFTSDRVNTVIKRSGTGANVVLDNIKIEPINAKYNATTIFYGDELNTTTNNKTFAGSGDWAAYNGTTVDVNSTVAGKMHITFEGDGTSQGAQLTIGNMGGTIVAGRKYRIEADLDYISGADTDIKMKFCIGGTNDATCVVSATDGSPSDGGITTTEETYYSEVVASNNTGALLILAKSAENDNASDPALITVDNVSVKEIGIASGWTDADQQLDIPQTALQSYNQLTFFDGKDNYYQTSSNITPGDHTSVSFWVFINQGGASDSYGLLRAGTYGDQNFRILGQTDKLDIVTYNEDESTVTETHSFATTVELGRWHHIAAYIPRQSGNSVILYFNGEKLTTDAMARDMKVEAHNWRLGLGYGITYQYLQGAMTEFSYFNVKLTDDEFLELYNDGKALNALDHSQAGNLVHYWRNEGLGNWNDLKGSNNLTPAGSPTETMLITAGVDSSRDSQGFLMNRQRTTNSANIAVLAKQDGTNDEGSYIYLPDNPLYTGSAVTNYTISFWVKFAVNPTDLDHNMHFIDTNQSDANRTFKIHITSGGVLYLYTYYDSSAGNKSVYCDYGFPGKLGNAIQTPPVNNNAGIGEAFDVNNWYHLTWTFDHDRTTGTTDADNTNSENHNFTPYKMYVNGICVAVEGREGANSAMTTARSMQASNTPVMIGTAIGSSTTPETGSEKDFKGQIDDICFYSDTLTDEEVLRNYNAGKRSHR